MNILWMGTVKIIQKMKRYELCVEQIYFSPSFWNVELDPTKKKSKILPPKTPKPNPNHNKKIEFAVFFQDPTLLHFNPISSPALLATTTPTSNPQQSSLAPAFLSRFPRSLSSLSLGGKKKSIDKDVANSSLISPNISANSDHLQSPVTSSALHLHSSHNALLSSVKNKFTSEQSVELRPGFVDKNRSKNQPPPLPLRNFPRRSQPATANASDGVDGENLIDLTSNSVTTASAAAAAAAAGVKKKGKSSADIDNKTNNNDKCNKNLTSSSSISAATSAANKVKKRNKAKIKANSDPKISAQLFLQMERDYDKQDLIAATGHSIANEPPPLPPRQPGMLEENQNLINNNKCGAGSSSSSAGGGANSRPPPNSVDSRMNYPLIATATAVRDNISPFVLSNRPNIRHRIAQSTQKAQQHVSNSDIVGTYNTPIKHKFEKKHMSKISNKLYSEETNKVQINIVVSLVNGHHSSYARIFNFFFSSFAHNHIKSLFITHTRHAYT